MVDNAPPKAPDSRDSAGSADDVGDRRGPDRRVDTPASEGRKSASVRQAIRSELEQDEPEDANAAAPRPRADSTPVVEMDHVSLAFEQPILEDVSLAACEGETVVLVGESGTGKSTALKLILRLLVPDSGRVLIEGQDITHLSFEEALEARQKMGMVFQGAALFDSMTVFENVAYPLREHTKMSDDEITDRVREKLEFVDLEADRVMQQMPAELSGGMRKRVGVARGMANNPRIMLYDEPTSGLDPLTTGTITRLIMKLQRELGVTSVVVSHDIRASFRMASKIALLHEKHIAFFGTPEEMTASEDKYIQDFLGGL
ncbi:MAG TPA: ABC transporter ATP-binding protein [Gemmatimonadaceae bacterium]|jgi:phospholipid/cholesterol/gamma-HCH transport system ATP-binding protein